MTLQRTLAVTACAIVLLGVALAFKLIGTPGHARKIALDQQRVRDLQAIGARLERRYSQPHPHLPARLPEYLVLKDPATQQPYTYKRVDNKRLMLCAVFDAPSEPDNSGSMVEYNAKFPDRWQHGEGRKCYTLDVTGDPLQPVELNVNG